MARTMFEMGVAGQPWFGRGVGPFTWNVSRAEVDHDRARILKRLPVAKGWTGEYPYVVRIEGEGEYLVRADGTAQFWNVRQNRWEPPQMIDNGPWVR